MTGFFIEAMWVWLFGCTFRFWCISKAFSTREMCFFMFFSRDSLKLRFGHTKQTFWKTHSTTKFFGKSAFSTHRSVLTDQCYRAVFWWETLGHAPEQHLHCGIVLLGDRCQWMLGLQGCWGGWFVSSSIHTKSWIQGFPQQIFAL